MPPLTLHTAIAKSMADRLRARVLDEQRGNLYLGATAPDIRVITRWDRADTHFFDLTCFDEQSGVSTLFHTHPSLATPSELDARTVAFMAGYISHLVMDERWITEVYRPFFGERSPLGGDIRANILDRALQFSLDADRRDDRELMAHILQAVLESDLEIEVSFIDRDTLSRWRDLIAEVTEQRPDWERFRKGAIRRLVGADASENGVEEMTRSLPDIVDEALRHLSRERIDSFLDDSLEASVLAAKEYLECA
jgi:hypothetical protein